ncbi:zinc-binding dehydrogenase [Microbacter sp. GSS18]|nr:zinc-binding dehydrogenase [Microbacter sp. GSS18]
MTDPTATPTEQRALVTAPEPTLLRLTQRPVPAPAAGEVLVRTHAVGVNNADIAGASDERVAGYEFSGVVTAVGAGVADDVLGVRVLGLTTGAFAEYVIADRRHVMPIPDELPFAEAAAAATALTTEYGALRRADLAPGETVLITAATSGIALLGVQIARALGAGQVIGTTRTADRRALVEQAGADAVVVTDAEDLAETVTSLTGGRGADVVLDHVGGALLDEAIASARPGGRVISVGRLAGPKAEIDLFALARSAATLQSVSFGFSPPTVLGDLLAGVQRDLSAALADGSVRPIVGEIVELDSLPALMVAVRDGRRVEGKIVALTGR